MMQKSKLCKEEDFSQDWYKNCCSKLGEPLKYHRKQWEFCYVYQSLLERKLLVPGKKGLGFGVGKEPLVSLFASHGCEILATDLESASSLGWETTSLMKLNEKGICDSEQFKKLVTFEYMDMNNINPKYFDSSDFTWSCCAFEHLGSINSGLQFVINQMKCLRPGGVAIHTTEYNLSSNDETFETYNLSIFRNKDMEWLVKELRNAGFSIDTDYSAGKGDIESYIDVPPYKQEPHLRLQIGKYVSTSIGLIIEKKAT